MLTISPVSFPKTCCPKPQNRPNQNTEHPVWFGNAKTSKIEEALTALAKSENPQDIKLFQDLQAIYGNFHLSLPDETLDNLERLGLVRRGGEDLYFQDDVAKGLKKLKLQGQQA